jgi:hypothetical protein
MALVGGPTSWVGFTLDIDILPAIARQTDHHAQGLIHAPGFQPWLDSVTAGPNVNERILTNHA